MSAAPANRRTGSRTGSSRLSLSVGKTQPPSSAPGIHPLKQQWSLSYVHRPPGTKVDYEKEIKRVATFGSIESFLHLYSHMTPPNELPPVTDLLVFLNRIGRPGVWEEMRDGGKFTLRLLHPITPLLFETLLMALVGDQFDDADGVVGCVLSVRQPEDILSVWVEEEGDSVRSGALREKILTLLSLPSSTLCEYRANKALLDAATKPFSANNNHHGNHSNTDGQTNGEGPNADRQRHAQDGNERGYSHRSYGGQAHQRELRESRNRDNAEREGYGARRENGWGGGGDRDRTRSHRPADS